MNENEKLSQLVSYLLSAKDAEDQARKHRIEIEEKIAALVPGPEKGQKTVTLEDGSKVTVERGLNYKADIAAIESLFRDESLKSLIPPLKSKTTVELDKDGYEWYRSQHGSVYEKIAEHVQVTPKKVAVRIQVTK